MRLRVLGAAVITAVAGLAGVPGAAAATAVRAPLLAETFSGASTEPGLWSAPSPKGAHQPCLTAATTPPEGSLPACNAVKAGGQPDPVGQGAFQLTDNSRNDAGALVLNKPLTTRNGLRIDFDMYQYRTSSSRGADGISFYFVDGAQPTVGVGDTGGGLGYTGVKGAVVGVGFDEYGNFARAVAGATDQDRSSPNTVGVRGAESARYRYVLGRPAPAPLAVDPATSRTAAKRHVTIGISPANNMSVSVDFGDGKGPRDLIKDLDLDSIPGQPKLPGSLKMAFAASTGNATNYHEISGFTAQTLDPKLSVQLGGEATVGAGQSAAASLTVGNDLVAGPTTGPITATYKIPAGLRVDSAAGDGWACQTASDTVTCTRPDVLAPGQTFPPIVLKYTATAPGSLTIAGTAGTPGEMTPGGAAAQLGVTVNKPPAPTAPQLQVKMTHDGDLVAGATTPYHVTVSNLDGAAPTSAPVTVRYTAPAGATLKAASGDGWTCTIAGSTATCTRPGTGADALPPGKGYPPVNLDVVYPASAVGTDVSPRATVSAGGDSDTSDNTAPPDLGTVQPAPAQTVKTGLRVAITADPGKYLPGKPLTYTVTVTNAGPSDAKDALLKVSLPEKFAKLLWTCDPSQGSTCPTPQQVGGVFQPLRGSLDTTVDVAAGGSVTLTLTCLAPANLTGGQQLSASITAPAGAVDSGCPNGCLATLTHQQCRPV